MAGNSIHWDRLFIRKYWPKLETRLHYQMLDVTAFKLIVQARSGFEFAKQETHRALDDIYESIAELKELLKRLSA